MARLTATEIRIELADITYYKWQFLRRNDTYAKDCAKWSGKPPEKWDKREIILGYPFEGNLKHFSAFVDQQFQNDVFKYYEKFLPEWNTLNDDPDFINSLRKKRFRPFVSRKSSSWRKYNEKWSINLPLNPKCEFIPFFVDIAPKETISETAYVGCPNGVFENDIWLRQGASSFIKVNWAADKKYLLHKFNELIDTKLRLLKYSNTMIADTRTHFGQFAIYSRAWDLRQQKNEIPKIGVILSDEFGDVKKSYDDNGVRRVLKAAEKLINGGYKHVG